MEGVELMNGNKDKLVSLEKSQRARSSETQLKSSVFSFHFRLVLSSVVGVGLFFAVSPLAATKSVKTRQP